MDKLIKNSLIIVCLAILCVSVPVFSATVMIEAENFTAYNDVALDLIRSVAASTCTGGYMLVGFDAPDEWVQYEFGVSAFGIYNVQLKVRGDYGVQYLFEVILTGHPSGDTQTTFIPFTGKGYG